jgi:hypothetical protein
MDPKLESIHSILFVLPTVWTEKRCTEGLMDFWTESLRRGGRRRLPAFVDAVAGCAYSHCSRLLGRFVSSMSKAMLLPLSAALLAFALMIAFAPFGT